MSKKTTLFILLFVSVSSLFAQSSSKVYNVNLTIYEQPNMDSLSSDTLIGALDTTTIKDVDLTLYFSLSDTIQTDSVFYTVESNQMILLNDFLDIDDLLSSNYPVYRDRNRFEVKLGRYSGSNFKIRIYLKDINGDNSVVRIYPDDL